MGERNPTLRNEVFLSIIGGTIIVNSSSKINVIEVILPFLL